MDKKKIKIIEFLVILAAVLGSYFYWQAKYYGEPYPNSNSQEAPSVTNDQQTPPQTSDQTPPPQNSPLENPTSWPTPASVEVKGVAVQWHTATTVPAPNVFNTVYDEYSGPTVKWMQANSHFYNIGTFTSGKYNGGTLILEQFPCDGPCMYSPWVYQKIISKDGKYTLLGQPDGQMFNINKGTFDAEYVIPGTPPDTLFDFKTGTSFTASARSVYMDKPLSREGFTVAFTDPNYGPIYVSKNKITPDGNPASTGFYSGGFFSFSPDGSITIYTEKFSFSGLDAGNNPTVAGVRWNNGNLNADVYRYQEEGGCGVQDLTDVVPDTELKQSELVPAGTTIDGKTIFALSDTNHPLLKSFYEEVTGQQNSKNYSNEAGYTFDQSKAPSYSAFLASHPLFFFVDPYNRIIRFHNSTIFETLGGCGKPVIYLYPTQAENVSVKLDPQGGFTKTEPAYENGWNVFAEPNGELMNLADKLVYPYLFWEGRGGFYQTPDRGWVVAQNDVHTFLTTKLTALGLNEKETADFMDFWEPRMTGSPYYFVTFMGNQTMDELAPLTVTPVPDTVIRILMDFKPLEKPITVSPFVIRTPERKGFTVVEWGGVLR